MVDQWPLIALPEEKSFLHLEKMEVSKGESNMKNLGNNSNHYTAQDIQRTRSKK